MTLRQAFVRYYPIGIYGKNPSLGPLALVLPSNARKPLFFRGLGVSGKQSGLSTKTAGSKKISPQIGKLGDIARRGQTGKQIGSPCPETTAPLVVCLLTGHFARNPFRVPKRRADVRNPALRDRPLLLAGFINDARLKHSLNGHASLVDAWARVCYICGVSVGCVATHHESE